MTNAFLVELIFWLAFVLWALGYNYGRGRSEVWFTSGPPLLLVVWVSILLLRYWHHLP